MMTRQVKCDRCGHTSQMCRFGNMAIDRPPLGWDVLDKFDLCPDCVKRACEKTEGEGGREGDSHDH